MGGTSKIVDRIEKAGLLTGRITWQQAIEDSAATLNVGSVDDAEHFWSLFDPLMGELPAVALR